MKCGKKPKNSVTDIKKMHLDHLGGSCFADACVDKRRDTDYDGPRDFNSFTIEKGERL